MTTPDFAALVRDMQTTPRTWLVTGAAGFIGSNLVETLLDLNQRVVGFDNFETGHQKNLDEVERLVAGKHGRERLSNFRFLNADIRDPKACCAAATGVDVVLHQAALGSVPRSIDEPLVTNAANIDGFVNMLDAARLAKARFVYAASSSTYGDSPTLPKVEDIIGKPLSPYAVTKYVNELYADVYGRCYGTECIGLRYFNVFGPRQDPDGAYAAVIPKWFAAFLKGEAPAINGDGETSRDFCYVDNVVQANILSGLVQNPAAVNQVYNVAFGQRTTLNQLYFKIRSRVADVRPQAAKLDPVYRDFRKGDVRHSLADISKANRLLGYAPALSVDQGLTKAASWYINDLS